MTASGERMGAVRGWLLRRTLLLDPVDGVLGLRDILIGSDGRIAMVSGPNAVERAPDGVPEIDIGGRPTIPGLTDTHFHVMATALAERAIALGGASTLDEITRATKVGAPDDRRLGHSQSL